MILVAGIPSEPPVEGVVEALAALGADVVVFNQRMLDDIDLDVSVDTHGSVGGVLRMGRQRWMLPDISAAYLRLMDDRRLPELAGEPADSPRRQRTRTLHDTLTTWLDVSPALVVNRASAMASNASKPYQAQLITRHGFRTPPTLVTNDPSKAKDFISTHHQVIYKSISGVRSIVQTFGVEDGARLDDIRFCPVQFQALVRGIDIRVHVVGTETHASEIRSDATDYRYAASQTSVPAQITATELADDVATRCVSLAADLGLAFAGIDLLVADDGEIYCFEVNPSPAYTYFEAHTQQPIAAAVARLLVG